MVTPRENGAFDGLLNAKKTSIYERLRDYTRVVYKSVDILSQIWERGRVNFVRKNGRITPFFNSFLYAVSSEDLVDSFLSASFWANRFRYIALKSTGDSCNGINAPA